MLKDLAKMALGAVIFAGISAAMAVVGIAPLNGGGPALTNNPISAAQDTINNATSITLTAHTSTAPACAKAGVWSAS